MKKKWPLILLCFVTVQLHAENGYDLWLRYKKIEDNRVLARYRLAINDIYLEEFSATATVIRHELSLALPSLLAKQIAFSSQVRKNGTLIIAKPGSLKAFKFAPNVRDLGNEGYHISTAVISGYRCIVITGNTDVALLYGVFHFLRHLQTLQPLGNINVTSTPKLQLRLLNHWDNLNRTVERGYAGISLWNWHTLPTYIDKRYKDYARANASIGINGTVLTNVNANATVLTTDYLEKVAALATVFRPYGIRVYLTARFSAPVEIGGLKTADPLDPAVNEWWRKKVNEIYQLIPDFGGFLVKANSEGQPGPQNYGRTHADGANMLATALRPHKGIVMWRAFVYSNEEPDDRHKQAYNEFVPLDGKFADNVMVQVKNGAIDFQPREPFHPLFGAMPFTPLMMEYQVTQEYLGQATNLVFLAPMYKECLASDTYAKGKGSTVASVIDGSVHEHKLSGMAGVSNTGNDINWTGHPFGQANWYAFGRLAWDHSISSESICEEWLRMTFSNNASFIQPIRQMMLRSHEIAVRYSTPIGLHHLMGTGHHYGPAPWVNNLSRADWNPVYYHRADSMGIGFNRTSTGSNALSQYAPPVRTQWEDPASIPMQLLLWFHHLPWKHRLNTGRTVWEELCYQYYSGADSVQWMQQQWSKVKSWVDEERHEQVRMLLDIQQQEAIWWRNACVLYFQTFSKLPIPPQYPSPGRSLDYYRSLKFPFAPGIAN